MYQISMPRGDSRVLRLRVAANGAAVILGEGDSGVFRVYDRCGATVMEKRLSAADQQPDGALEIPIDAQDTASYGAGCTWLKAGEVVALLWELELTVSGKVVTPALAEPFELIIDNITPAGGDSA